VREDRGTATEPHCFAKIVSSFFTEIARPAIDAGLDGNSLTGEKVFDAGTDSGNYSGCLVTQNKGCTNSKVTIAAMTIVVYWMCVWSERG
jgi:hypothetical protein